MTKAMYAFSGDPITYGHIDIIKRAAAIFDEIIVGIGTNPDKKYLFSLEERTEMAQRSLCSFQNVEVISFEGLLVDYAYEHNIPVIIKGVRDEKDLAYEEVLHYAGQSQKLGIETFLLPTMPKKVHISSSMAKAMQKEHGEIHQYVTFSVKQCLEEKISHQYIVGVTGETGVGKSTLCTFWEEHGKNKGISVHHIELDQIGHDILSKLQEPVYQKIRKKIVRAFGAVQQQDGTIDRKALGDIVFQDSAKIKKLNEIMHKPIRVRLRHELRGKNGIILLNAALLAETETTYLCNNNVILITADKQSQERRLQERNLDMEQITRRLASQYTAEQKKCMVEKEMAKQHHGKVWVIDNSDGCNEKEREHVFDEVIKELKVK